MNRSVLVGAASLLVVVGALILIVTVSAMNRNSSQKGGYSVADSSSSVHPSEDWLTSYRLTDQMGRAYPSENLDDRVHVVSFFFSSCPGPCLKQNRKLAELSTEFDGQDVSFVSITCDPETDTPSVLNQYARKLEATANWVFLTGQLEYIKRVAAEVYSVPLDKGTHVESFMVIDKWGVRRGKFHWNDAAEIAALRKLIPALITETSPPEPPIKPLRPSDESEDEEEMTSSDPNRDPSKSPATEPTE